VICQGLPLCGGPLSLLSQYQVRQAVSGFMRPATEYHLHRKTLVLPCELAKCYAFRDLSVGPTMFFSRRWILCCRTRNTRTARLICCCSSRQHRNHPLQKWIRYFAAAHELPEQPARSAAARQVDTDIILIKDECHSAAHELPEQPDPICCCSSSRHSPPYLLFLKHKSSKKG